MEDKNANFVDEAEEIALDERLIELSKLYVTRDLSGSLFKDKINAKKNVDFLRKRSRATKTMSNNILKYLDKIGLSSSIAVIVGEAHKKSMLAQLSYSKRPIVVFSPNAEGPNDVITPPKNTAQYRRECRRVRTF
jgi:uncharacterized membrane protein YgaE (UPF0421/DUF939 family)